MESSRLTTRVGVVGAVKGCGASFTAVQLALYSGKVLKKKTSYVQMDDNNYVYNAYGFDKRFAGRTLCDARRMISQGSEIRDIRNIEENVNWIINIPGNEKLNSLNSSGFKLLRDFGSELVFYDFGCRTDEMMMNLLSEMDRIILVIDPLPSRLLESRENLKKIMKLKSSGTATLLVINKMNSGVNMRELSGFMGSFEGIEIPILDPEMIYMLEYRCEFPMSRPETADKLKGAMEKISRIIT